MSKSKLLIDLPNIALSRTYLFSHPSVLDSLTPFIKNSSIRLAGLKLMNRSMMHPYGVTLSDYWNGPTKAGLAMNYQNSSSLLVRE